MKMNHLLVIVLALGFSTAYADNDPRFSMDAAAKAFASAQAPTAEQLLGKWMEVGIAEESSLIPLITVPVAPIVGYWPDGQLTMSGEPGHFHDFLTFAQTTDAFGSSELTDTEAVLGAETGKQYVQAGPNLITITSEGAQYPTTPTSKIGCAGTDVCRITNNGMLLCATTVTDTTTQNSEINCSIYAPYVGVATNYHGFIRASGN